MSGALVRVPTADITAGLVARAHGVVMPPVLGVHGQAWTGITPDPVSRKTAATRNALKLMVAAMAAVS